MKRLRVDVTAGTLSRRPLLPPIMKAATLALVLAVFAGCATAATKANVKYRTLQSGAYAAASYGTPSVIVAHDADTYRRIWNIVIGPAAPPAVDFRSETAVFLVDQQRSTGGYSLAADGVAVDRGSVKVKVTMHRPQRGSAVAQVLTSPFTVIAVAATKLHSAEWLDSASGKSIARDSKPKDKTAAQ